MEAPPLSQTSTGFKVIMPSLRPCMLRRGASGLAGTRTQNPRNQSASATLESAMKELIAAEASAEKSERYCNDLAIRLGRLCAAFTLPRTC
jgi:hypothetical protein